MPHDHSPEREYVPVEAGVVAEVNTGELRFLWQEEHHCLLEETMNKKRAARRRRARVVKAVGLLMVLAILGALVVLTTR